VPHLFVRGALPPCRSLRTSIDIGGSPPVLIRGLRLHLLCPCTGFRSASPSPAPRPTNGRCCSASSTPTLTAVRTGRTVIADPGLLRPTVRDPAGRPRHHPAATGPGRPATAVTRARVRAAATGDRVDQRHPQGPARPRTTRQAHTIGVWGRVLQRVLSLTAAIWHDDHIGAPAPGSLIACHH
jgi:hypothetical protein